jgi:F-box and WD-40 domain protein 1/11
MEGWCSNFAQVRAYEDDEKGRRAEMKERRTRPRAAEDMDHEKPSSKRRLKGRALFGDGALSDNSIHDKLEPLSLNSSKDGLPDWAEQHGVVEADDGPILRSDDQFMEDVFYNSSSTENMHRNKKGLEQNDESLTSPTISDSIDPPVRPALLLPSTAEPRVNWQFLYKQKRRLEDNWDAGRYTNFQLPHPNFPLEAHTECVYTIQYAGKFLVSGSRDKSLRIWNLDTQRLILPPLVAHTGSVLCLQFDERPGEDIVISGGSDCRVIVWRFSTGKIIRVIEQAHAESVLNLRFDERYLVTCSKDKTIKVWNRKELRPTDDAYPSSTTQSSARFPSYIVNMQQHIEDTHLHFNSLTPYNVLMTLEGHGAAVNAIQIFDGQIVSASGDRSVKVWDVRTGRCIRSFPGHSKGIACVQFDGRRIVSGSSDETVRIFDRATGAEVACLQGHSNLVRTVQAQFGDLPGNEEELEAEARAVDRNFFDAQSRGQVPSELTRAQRRARNAGSRDPTALFAYGAKLPPGGGGSRWARIVSGSYDETVIIWKKGTDGAWEKSKVLYQNEAVKAAGGRPRRPAGGNHAHANHANAGQPIPPALPSFQTLAQGAQAHAQAAPSASQQAQALHAASQASQQGNTHVATTNGTPAVPPTAPPASAPTTTGNQGQASNPAQQQQQQQPPQQAAGPNNAPHHHHHHHHHAHPTNTLNQQGTNSRVFKLQFDARRIICCSQDPTIVGWDFANNDKDITLASQFFSDSI